MAKVRDFMTADVLSVSPDLTLRFALELLASRHLSGAPVIGAGHVLGVVSTSDLLSFQASTPAVPVEEPGRLEWDQEPPEEWVEGDEAPAAFFTDIWTDAGADVAERLAEVRGAEWDVLEEHTVREAMSHVTCEVSPDADLREAAATMVRHDIHRLLVTENKKLLGILSTLDIVRAVAEGRA
ncbi:MAG TPA: CBS domain-containing protein [Gemmatimonadales bacterium]|nr:CBS domain-containing protein [Gemmatimonadales bacterium]